MGDIHRRKEPNVAALNANDSAVPASVVHAESRPLSQPRAIKVKAKRPGASQQGRSDQSRVQEEPKYQHKLERKGESVAARRELSAAAYKGSHGSSQEVDYQEYFSVAVGKSERPARVKEISTPLQVAPSKNNKSPYTKRSYAFLQAHQGSKGWKVTSPSLIKYCWNALGDPQPSFDPHLVESLLTRTINVSNVLPGGGAVPYQVVHRLTCPGASSEGNKRAWKGLPPAPVQKAFADIKLQELGTEYVLLEQRAVAGKRVRLSDLRHAIAATAKCIFRLQTLLLTLILTCLLSADTVEACSVRVSSVAGVSTIVGTWSLEACPEVLCGANLTDVGSVWPFSDPVFCDEGSHEWLLAPTRLHDWTSWEVFHSVERGERLYIVPNRSFWALRGEIGCEVTVTHEEGQVGLNRFAFDAGDVGGLVVLNMPEEARIFGHVSGKVCGAHSSFMVEKQVGSDIQYVFAEKSGDSFGVFRLYVTQASIVVEPNITVSGCERGCEVDFSGSEAGVSFHAITCRGCNSTEVEFGSTKSASPPKVNLEMIDCFTWATVARPHVCAFNERMSNNILEGCVACEAGKYGLGACGTAGGACKLPQDVSTEIMKSPAAPVGCEFCGDVAECGPSAFASDLGEFWGGEYQGPWDTKPQSFRVFHADGNNERDHIIVALALHALERRAACPTWVDGLCLSATCIGGSGSKTNQDVCAGIIVGSETTEPLPSHNRCWWGGTTSRQRGYVNMYYTDWWYQQPEIWHMVMRADSRCCSCDVTMLVGGHREGVVEHAGFKCHNQSAIQTTPAGVGVVAVARKAAATCSVSIDHTSYEVDCGWDSILRVDVVMCDVSHVYYAAPVGLSQSVVHFVEVDAHARCRGAATLSVEFGDPAIPKWSYEYDHRAVSRCELYDDTSFGDAVTWDTPLRCWSWSVVLAIVCTVLGSLVVLSCLLWKLWPKCLCWRGYTRINDQSSVVVAIQGKADDVEAPPKKKTRRGKGRNKAAKALAAVGAAVSLGGRSGASACDPSTIFGGSGGDIVMTGLRTGGTYCVESAAGKVASTFCNVTVVDIDVVLRPDDCYVTADVDLQRSQQVYCDGAHGCSADHCSSYDSELHQLDGKVVEAMEGASFSTCERVTYDRVQCGGAGGVGSVFQHHRRRCQIVGWKATMAKDAAHWSVCRAVSAGAVATIRYDCHDRGVDHRGSVVVGNVVAGQQSIAGGFTFGQVSLQGVRDLASLAFGDRLLAYRKDGEVVLLSACKNGDPCDGFGAVQWHGAGTPIIWGGVGNDFRDAVEDVEKDLGAPGSSTSHDGVVLPATVGGLMVKQNGSHLFVRDDQAMLGIVLGGVPDAVQFSELICAELVAVEGGGGCFDCPSSAGVNVRLKRGRACSAGLVRVALFQDGMEVASRWCAVGTEVAEFTIKFAARDKKSNLEVRGFDSTGEVTFKRAVTVTASKYDPTLGHKGVYGDYRHEKSFPKLGLGLGLGLGLPVLLLLCCACVLFFRK